MCVEGEDISTKRGGELNNKRYVAHFIWYSTAFNLEVHLGDFAAIFARRIIVQRLVLNCSCREALLHALAGLRSLAEQQLHKCPHNGVGSSTAHDWNQIEKT